MFFVQQLGVRDVKGVGSVGDVLPTFKTVVMYGHFDENRATRCHQIVEIKPNFPVFYRGLKNGVMSTKTIT